MYGFADAMRFLLERAMGNTRGKGAFVWCNIQQVREGGGFFRHVRQRFFFLSSGYPPSPSHTNAGE